MSDLSICILICTQVKPFKLNILNSNSMLLIWVVIRQVLVLLRSMVVQIPLIENVDSNEIIIVDQDTK